MYCPQCKLKYDTKDSKCPDCRTLLIKNLNGQSSAIRPDNCWVIIAGVNDDVNKELAKGAMDSGNIPSLFINTENEKDTELLETLINNDSSFEIEKNIIMVPKEYRLDALLLLKGLFGVEIEIEIKEKTRYNT